MGYIDSSGTQKNLTQQVKNIQGRAFYQADKYWIDSNLQEKGSKKVNRVKFASREYFDLIKKNPDIVELLALGRNIRFEYDDNSYEIYE